MDHIDVLADQTMPSTLYAEWIFEHFIRSPAAAERLVGRSAAVAELRRTLLFIEIEYPGSAIMDYFEEAVRAPLPSLLRL